MALLLHSSSSSTITNKLHLLRSSPNHFLSQSKLKNLSIKCQDDPSSSSSNSSESTTTILSTPASAGLGFGNSTTNSTTQITSKKKHKGKIIRRAPLVKVKPPSFDTRKEEDIVEIKARSEKEGVFVIGWIGFGAVIILEGIVLASSGFLPEEWDKFLVKYLYPSFTPTVFLFVAGTAAYGLQKYFQNDNKTLN